MKFRLLIVLFFLESCSPNYTKIDNRKPYNSTGFAYIFNESDYENKIIKKKLNNDQLEISHSDLKTGSLIKLIKNLSDCKGQVIRTTPSLLHIEIFRKLGFIPKPLDVRDFKLAIEKNDIDAQENPLTNYWNFGVYKKQEFVSLTSHIFGFCLFVINDDYFNKLSDLNKKFLINKSKETTKFQRSLAISEDDILIKKIKSKNIIIENIDQDGLENFKSATNNFHESYFQTYPHMKQYIKTE